MSSNYNILITKIELFIRKYYLNEIIKGILLFIFIGLFSWLIAITLEYFGQFSVLFRTILFYGLITSYIIIAVKYIIVPLLKLFKIGGRLNKKQAAKIISKHFMPIQDQMLNVLELAEMDKVKSMSAELILASIDHKIQNIQPYPFEKAIDSKKTKILFYRFIFIVVLFSTMLYTTPEIIKTGSTRIINYSTPFVPEAPFQFNLLNDTFWVEKGKDYQIKINIIGRYIPANVFLKYGDARFVMEKIAPNMFVYNLRNVNNDLKFYFQAEEFFSSQYILEVLPTPSLIKFVIDVDVPDYTGEKDYTIENIGDITVPAGTNISWTFYTDNVESLSLLVNDSTIINSEKEKNLFKVKRNFKTSTRYTINTKNEHFNNNNLISYFINVLPDMFPEIAVEALTDSIRPGVYYFKGQISDDYGFNDLTFNYSIKEEKDSLVKINIPISKNTTKQNFFFVYDFSELNIKGSSVEFYFEVWDNDKVNGSKSARSQIDVFAAPSAKEIREQMNESEKNVEKSLDDSFKLTENIREELKKLKRDLLNDNLSQWEQTQKLNSIIQQYNELEKSIQNISKEFEKRNEFQNTYNEQSKEVMEKQMQIEELLNNLIDDELKALMEELNKLMENFDKSKLNELTEKIDFNLDDLNRQLDRNLELLKKLQLEEKINHIADQLKDLSEKQQELSNETKSGDLSKEELMHKQEAITEEFNSLKEEYEKALEQNKELAFPLNMPDMKENADNVNKEINKANEQLSKDNKSKASESQKKAADEMQKMGANMSMDVQQGMCGAQREDMDKLRNILSNLLHFSFSQEDLMLEFRTIQQRDPKYLDKIAEQKVLNNGFETLRDSLNALAKRTPQISSVINKELRSILRDSDEVISLLDDKKTNLARTKQQFIMTSANNLALLLDEVLDQMIKNSQQMQGGGGQCSNPDNEGMSMQQMKSLQQSLKQQMQSMIDHLKDGKDGKNGKQSSESLGKMLAEQEKFRQSLNEMLRSGGLSPQSAKELREINQLLEEVEKDIIGRNVSQRTIIRQEQIMTRLLEAERSEYEREIDNNRESRQGKNREISNPEELFKYKELNLPLNETLDEKQIRLVRFYNNMYLEYLNNLNK